MTLKEKKAFAIRKFWAFDMWFDKQCHEPLMHIWFHRFYRPERTNRNKKLCQPVGTSHSCECGYDIPPPFGFNEYSLRWELTSNMRMRWLNSLQFQFTLSPCHQVSFHSLSLRSLHGENLKLNLSILDCGCPKNFVYRCYLLVFRKNAWIIIST